jgi:hypothetical protein
MDHTETVVDRGVAYVKDTLGIPPDSEDTLSIPPVREHDPSTDEALRLEDPHLYTFNKIVERSRLTSMDTEENTAADAHMDAAEKIDHAEGSVRKALDDIQDVSRDMRRRREEPVLQRHYQRCGRPDE